MYSQSSLTLGCLSFSFSVLRNKILMLSELVMNTAQPLVTSVNNIINKFVFIILMPIFITYLYIHIYEIGIYSAQISKPAMVIDQVGLSIVSQTPSVGFSNLVVIGPKSANGLAFSSCLLSFVHHLLYI